MPLTRTKAYQKTKTMFGTLPDSSDQPKSAEEDPEIDRTMIQQESALSHQGSSENDSFGSVVTIQSVRAVIA